MKTTDKDQYKFHDLGDQFIGSDYVTLSVLRPVRWSTFGEGGRRSVEV